MAKGPRLSSNVQELETCVWRNCVRRPRYHWVCRLCAHLRGATALPVARLLGGGPALSCADPGRRWPAAAGRGHICDVRPFASTCTRIALTPVLKCLHAQAFSAFGIGRGGAPRVPGEGQTLRDDIPRRLGACVLITPRTSSKALPCSPVLAVAFSGT